MSFEGLFQPRERDLAEAALLGELAWQSGFAGLDLLAGQDAGGIGHGRHAQNALGIDDDPGVRLNLLGQPLSSPTEDGRNRQNQAQLMRKIPPEHAQDPPLPSCPVRPHP